MSKLDAKSYAEVAGITPERVRQLARAGRLKADIFEGRWQIEYEGHARVAPTRRPLSAQSRADLLRFFATMKLDHVKGVRKQRVAERYRTLMAAPSRAALLLEWWGGDEPEGTFAERNFIRAAQLGDEDALKAMLEFPRGWPLYSAEEFASRFRDRMALLGIDVKSVAETAELPEATVRDLARRGEGHGLTPKLGALRAIDLQPSMVWAA